MNVKLINTQKTLSPTNITLAGYVINPYRGCEFGCLYCYCRQNKNVKKEDFSNFLGVKINAPCQLKKELQFKRPKRVLLGSVTECFQYQEPKYKISEEILKILNSENIPYTILTKSHLIKNYLALIAKNKKNKIYFTLNLSRDNMIKALEPRSGALKERLKTIDEIIRAGINLRIHIGPFIPFISNLKEIFTLIPLKAKEADIELYHNKQGNFKAILSAVESLSGKEISKQLENIYSSKENYLSFAEATKEEAKKLKKQYNLKIFYIIPDFDEYYNSLIDYENTLL